MASADAYSFSKTADIRILVGIPVIKKHGQMIFAEGMAVQVIEDEILVQ